MEGAKPTKLVNYKEINLCLDMLILSYPNLFCGSAKIDFRFRTSHFRRGCEVQSNQILLAYQF